MAVFMMNICKYRGCGLVFPSLVHLIQHIEDTHIDNDPKTILQKESSQPSCIPLSNVLRFFTESSRREFLNTPPAPPAAPPAPPAPASRRRLLSTPKAQSVRSNTPTGSDFDEDDTNERTCFPSEDSNDSWTTVDEYSSDFILRHGIKMNAAQPLPGGAAGASAGAPGATAGAGAGAGAGAVAGGPAAPDKPFACPVPGCKKRYKNVNGIKYHSKNGHKKDGKIRKGFKCPCGKSYKSPAGLKNHSARHVPAFIAAGDHRSVLMPGLVVTSRPRGPGAAGGAGAAGGDYQRLTPRDIPALGHRPTSHTSPPGLLTPGATPETSPQDKTKGQPQLTVHSGPPQTKELAYVAKSY